MVLSVFIASPPYLCSEVLSSGVSELLKRHLGFVVQQCLLSECVLC